MKITEARNLKTDQRVKDKRGNEFTVWTMNEFIPATGGNTIIYIKCKDENGNIMKFSHKELSIV